MRAEPTTEKSSVRPGPWNALVDYVRDVRVEMSKVSWPTRRELRESTIVVIVMVIIMAVFTGVVDRVLSLAFEALLRLLG